MAPVRARASRADALTAARARAVPLASLLECQGWSEAAGMKDNIRCREYDLDGHEDLQDDKMIADLIAITTGNRNVIQTSVRGE